MKKSHLIKITALLAILFTINCYRRAEVTSDTTLYSSPGLEESAKVTELKKGTSVLASEFRNHTMYAKKAIKVKTEDGKSGYVAPTAVVVGQDAERSVFKTGYRKDYERFYKASDKAHYKKGLEYESLSKLPKDKIPLEELVKE